MKKLILLLFMIFCTVSLSGVQAGETFLPHGLATGGGNDVDGTVTAATATFIVSKEGDISMTDDVALTGDLTIVGELLLAIQAVSPNTSATTSITSPTVLFYNGATIGTANVVLPASPSDGQRVVIASQPAITVLALTSDATAINGATTALSADTSAEYMYSAITTDWHKLR